jgi:hypothetical protein
MGVDRRRVGAIEEKNPNQVAVAHGGGRVERCAAVCVCRVRVSAVGKKCQEHLGLGLA